MLYATVCDEFEYLSPVYGLPQARVILLLVESLSKQEESEIVVLLPHRRPLQTTSLDK